MPKQGRGLAGHSSVGIRMKYEDTSAKQRRRKDAGALQTSQSKHDEKYLRVTFAAPKPAHGRAMNKDRTTHSILSALPQNIDLAGVMIANSQHSQGFTL